VTTFALALANFLAQAAPFIVVGYMAAALIKEFVPVEVFVRYFGGKGMRPLLRAIGVGALLPICSCGVIPVGVGAFKCGASRGTTLAFMTAGPTISPVAVLLAFSLLGPKLAICFVVAALIGSLAIGTIANRFLSGPDEDALRAASLARADDETLPVSTNRTFLSKMRGAAKWAFWDLGTDISVDLLLGLCIAAGLIAVLPQGWVGEWLGHQSFMTLVYVMIVGIPLYTCTVPSIPIAQSLLLLGMSPGAAIAYLISGPATNLGEVNVIRANLGGRTAVAFVAGLLSIALVGGLLTDWLVYPGFEAHAATEGSRQLVTEAFVGPLATGDRAAVLRGSLASIPSWSWPFMAVLGAALAIGLVRRANGVLERRRERRAAAALPALATAETSELVRS
jgi:uncharacterized membrane protein YraQ (UPF0718 family)